MLSLEPLAPATFTREDGHGPRTVSALLARALAFKGEERAQVLGLLSTLACPDVGGFFVPSSDDPEKAPALATLSAQKDALFQVAKDRDAKVRAAAWLLLVRVLRAELAPAITSAFLTEKDKTVRPALYLAATALSLGGTTLPIDPRADAKLPGLLGWSAALYLTAAERRAHGASGLALLAHLKKPALVPEFWALIGEDETSTTAAITAALLAEVEVETSLLEALFRGLSGPTASRRIATVAFGALTDWIDASGSARTKLAHAPLGVAAHALTPLQREALIALRRITPWDWQLGWALGLGGVDDVEPMLARQGPFAPLDPPLEGFEGASLAWLMRGAVLVQAPSPSVLLAHLSTLPAEPLLSLVLARMPRVLLLQQIAMHDEPEACRARDAQILDALGADPRFGAALRAHLSAFALLGADDGRALGRMLAATADLSADERERAAALPR